MSAAERSDVPDRIREIDAAFAAGDADRWASFFAADARLFLLYRDALVGRDAIHEWARSSMPQFDLSAWEAVTDPVEVHGDHAYAFATYTERLLSREDGSRTLVRGRLVYFLRRDADEGWRIRLLMHSHSHPMEPLP